MRLITCPTKNPKVSSLGQVSVDSIYRRTKTGDYQRDGNPFIYALKRINGFRISNKELYKFKSSFYTILASSLSGHKIDFILPMPSSHPIANYLANRISRLTGATVINDYFLKQTTSGILNNFNHNHVEDKHKSEVLKQLASYQKLPANSQISLKKIPNKIRFYFPPLVLNPKYIAHTVTGSVLLVDDLLSTGTTLVSAKSLINSDNVKGICLLSDL